MAKSSQKNSSNDSSSNNQSSTTSTTTTVVTKVKRTRRSVPRDSPPQRSSIYRGVTRHRWTGRYEAHLWDKNCWNESQNKKGRQVYLGAYDDEEAAAHAYDLAALKYWGEDTILNFPASTYEKEIKEMEAQSREEYIGSLRRKSSGFSRGVSKYRGVARHHHNGRWEARIGRVFGNKYLYLGTYATQEEAATAYDMAAIEYRGLNAVTNFDLSRYIKWLKPNNIANNTNDNALLNLNPNPNPTLPNLTYNLTSSLAPNPKQEPATGLDFFRNHSSSLINRGESMLTSTASQTESTIATSALGLLLQSSKFKEMMEMTEMSASTVADHQFVPLSTQPADDGRSDRLPQCTFPKDIQTYFACDNSTNYSEGDEFVFGDLNSFNPTMFQCDFEA